MASGSYHIVISSSGDQVEVTIEEGSTGYERKFIKPDMMAAFVAVKAVIECLEKAENEVESEAE